MASPKVADYLNNQIAICGKSQKDIAFEAGYQRPNIITMFKQGVTKVPIAAAPKIAKAIGSDPAFFLRLVLHEYHPELLETIEKDLGGFCTVNEASILNLLRDSTGNTDPVIPNKTAENKLRAAFKANLT